MEKLQSHLVQNYAMPDYTMHALFNSSKLIMALVGTGILERNNVDTVYKIILK